MSVDFPRKSGQEILTELGRRFREPARDRRVYCVLGTYAQLDKFVKSVRELCQNNALGEDSKRVMFFDLNKALLSSLEAEDQLEKALELGDKLRIKELTRVVADLWPVWLSQKVKASHGLILAGFELFFAYLDSNALALVRQYAINGKHICLILPGTERDRQVCAFDETPEYRRLITGLVSEWTYILE